jgi:hypothetical protein
MQRTTLPITNARSHEAALSHMEMRDWHRKPAIDINRYNQRKDIAGACDILPLIISIYIDAPSFDQTPAGNIPPPRTLCSNIVARAAADYSLATSLCRLAHLVVPSIHGVVCQKEQKAHLKTRSGHAMSLLRHLARSQQPTCAISKDIRALDQVATFECRAPAVFKICQAVFGLIWRAQDHGP